MDMKGSRTAALASAIAASVSKIDEFLSSNGLPPLSLDPDAPLQQPSSKEFTRARDATLDAISELEALVLGPLGVLHKASAAVNFLSFLFFWCSSTTKKSILTLSSTIPQSVYRPFVASTLQQVFPPMKPHMKMFLELADWTHPIYTEYYDTP